VDIIGLNRGARWLLVVLILASPSAWAGKKGKKKKEVVPPAPVEAPVGKIEMPCDWPAGTVFHYKYVRLREDTRQPLLAEVTMTAPVTITVTAPGNPLSLEYVAGTMEFLGPPEVIEAVGNLQSELPSLPMQLVLTDGALSGLANHQALVDAAEPLLRQMTAGAPAAIVEQTLQLLRDPVQGPMLLLRDPARFFAMHCVAMAEGEVLESPILTPNPLGGPPLPSTSRVVLTQHDVSAGTITFETLDKLAPEALQHLMTSAMEKFAPGQTDPAMLEQILAQMPPIEAVTTGKMVYSTEDGFPLSVEVHHDVGAAEHPMHRADTWIWTRTQP
jgi:hypothetical protein